MKRVIVLFVWVAGLVLLASNEMIAQRPGLRQAPVNTTTTDTTGRKSQPGKLPTNAKGSRIVDDSTKSVYGPQTTLWTTEKDIFYGTGRYQPLDTSIHNFHRWTYYHRLNYLYQDLGNNGTALNSIFPTLPQETIGASLGFNAFGQYFHSQVPIFFDTKSPYSRMYLVWGGQGRAMTQVEFSRNISPRWNFGFNYRPILTDKQVQRRRGDRNVVSHYYDVYSYYKSKDSLYSNLVTYRRIRHRVNENGGIIPSLPVDLEGDEDATFEQTYPYYFEGNTRPTLVAASSYEQRNVLHVLQQYNLVKEGMQVYHMGELARQMNWYKDNLDNEKEPFYDEQLIDTARVLDSTRMSYLQNQIGVKGRLGKNKKLFYNGFYKIKSYELNYRYVQVDTVGSLRKNDEHYLGGSLHYSIDSVQSVLVDAEFLEGGYSRIRAEGNTRWLDVDAQRQIAKPGFLPSIYRGHFDSWTNQFKPVESTQIKFFPKVSVGPLFVSLGITLTELKNYIYYARQDTFPGTDQQVLPLQASNNIRLATPEFRMDVRFLRHFHLRPQVMYSKVLLDKDSILRVPEVFFTGQIAYENELFKKNLQVQIGFDFHYHSAYKALGYDPVIQNFYIQNDITTPAFWQADFFFNAKMKRGRFFVKYHNILQAFTTLSDQVLIKGYMPTPFYPGQQNILDFGFDILLFD